MTAKRFIGNDLRRLYARVEREFGPEALILGTRSLERPGAEPLIELMAAPPQDGEALPFELQTAMVDAVLSRVNPSLTVGDLEDLLAREDAGSDWRGPGEAAVPGTGEPSFAMSEAIMPADQVRFRSAYAPRYASPLQEVLVEAGLSEAAAEAVAAAAPAGTDPCAALAAALATMPVAYPEEGVTAIITIQGPPGSGTTTALLRMALDCADSGREAGLVAADASQAGRREQLHAYAGAMGLRAFDAPDGPSLLRVANRAPAGCCLFVDVPGGPWHPPAALASRHYGYLALPGHWATGVLRDALAAYPIPALRGAVPTFTDLATDLSPTLSLLLETGLGIAFLSSGRDIATGITVADPFTLASGIFTMATGDRTDGHLAIAG